MKVYVVYKESPVQIFLEAEKAMQYIQFVNTSPSKIDHYKIKIMETVDELFSKFEIVTNYWFHYDLKDGKDHFFFLSTREQNSLDNELSFSENTLRYEEKLYHNSEKPRVRTIMGNYYIERRESDINFDLYRERFDTNCKALLENIIQFRTKEQWSVDQINKWLPKDLFIIN
ncbi:hypothetical protein QUF84_00350 [Fictibacillus enclensis]|uniref:hypothetical protein n=1 Tax=Fictibacillus enclensis TaxID=1017270 RepID=UPI0025A229D7|nr:hypothetical protein [Fictibacillus enclensis]MDM5335746.1 hypothetical protein [Fictibacillus enclensis]